MSKNDNNFGIFKSHIAVAFVVKFTITQPKLFAMRILRFAILLSSLFSGYHVDTTNPYENAEFIRKSIVHGSFVYSGPVQYPA